MKSIMNNKEKKIMYNQLDMLFLSDFAASVKYAQYVTFERNGTLKRHFTAKAKIHFAIFN